MNFNANTFRDLTAYRDDVKPPVVVTNRIAQAISLCNPVSILDYGCGTGRYSAKYANDYEVYGYEPVQEAMREASKRGVKYWRGDSVGLIMCIEVIEHLIDPLQDLKTMYDALNPNGYIILTTPNAIWWKHRINMLFGKLSYVDSDGYNAATTPHIRMWTFDSLQKALQETGFNVFPGHRWGTYAGFPGGSFLMSCGFESLLSAGIIMMASK